MAADAIKATDSNLADQAVTETEAMAVTSSGETRVWGWALSGWVWVRH